ncbi:MAG: hypothetical protein FD181_813 [Prolixibacteraceae bacterium]|nr:MAG: hypothetical protein FD181_813 [Prolixibacteraceae bacterium]
MKVFKNMKIISVILITVFWMTGCNKDETDFGFDASFSGILKDRAGKIVAGDITNNNLRVNVLSEGDLSPVIIRVKGDGTYQNTKIFPSKAKIWVSGPVAMTSDTLRVDFKETPVIMHDFVVEPFISFVTPTVVSAPTETSVSIRYEIIPGTGKEINLRQVFVSSSPFPNATTGSGAFFQTLSASMTTNSGTVTVSGLSSKTKYYIRIAARAAGTTAFNFSEQILTNTP